MHELGIVFHIIKSLEELSKEQEITKINSVTMEIGEVSAVVDEYLGDCWKWAVNRTDLLKGAELKTESIKAVTFCESCKSKYETVKFGRICPSCKSEKTYLITGNEINIKEIEAY